MRVYQKYFRLCFSLLFQTQSSGVLKIISCRHLKYISSSSSCCAASTDIPDPLSPLLPFVHRFWQGYIQYPHGAAVYRFELVALLLLGHVRGSIGEHHIWARPCFSSMSGSSNFDSFRDGGGVDGCTAADLWSLAFRISSRLLAAFFCSYRQAFSPSVLSASMKCIHIAVSTRSLLGRNCVSFYRSGFTSIWPTVYR